MNMNGTESMQVDYLYKGIIDYFSNMSGLDISSSDLIMRDKFIADSAIVCDSSLDDAVIELQDRYIAANNNIALQREIIQETINLLR